jgi:predicted permease
VRTEPSARRLTRPTDYSPTNVGAGAGLVLGAGIAVTTALFVGSDVALAAGYGTAGGLLVGAMVGRILESAREHETPGLRVVTLALLSGTVVGGVLGLLAAWGIDESLLAGVEVGGAAGALVAVLVVNVLVASIHRQRRSESVEVVENSRGA